MKFTLLLAALSLGIFDANSNDLVKIASVNNGDLLANSSDSVETREWTPRKNWIMSQRDLLTIAERRLNDRLKASKDEPNVELTHVVWTRSFEGWWFLQVQFLLIRDDVSSARGESLESVFLLPNGGDLLLKSNY